MFVKFSKTHATYLAVSFGLSGLTFSTNLSTQITCAGQMLIVHVPINTALHGATSLSGVDAYAWRYMCTSFSEASVELCEALTSVAL